MYKHMKISLWKLKDPIKTVFTTVSHAKNSLYYQRGYIYMGQSHYMLE